MQHRVCLSRRRAGVAVAAVASAAAAVAIGAATAPMAVASASKCPTSGLVVWLDTQGDGAAGSTFFTLKFTNLSGYACTLAGYPGVSAVNLAGQQVGSSASRDSAHSPKTVTLANGATASATLRIVDVLNFPSARCSRVTAAGLRVFPPNQTVSRVVPFPFGACSHTGTVYLSVRAVTKS